MLEKTLTAIMVAFAIILNGILFWEVIKAITG